MGLQKHMTLKRIEFLKQPNIIQNYLVNTATSHWPFSPGLSSCDFFPSPDKKSKKCGGQFHCLKPLLKIPNTGFQFISFRVEMCCVYWFEFMQKCVGVKSK